MTEIAVLNQSSRVTNVDANLMSEACNTQLWKHVAPYWKFEVPNVKFYADATKVPATSLQVIILDSSAQAGVLGYHSETNDIPGGFVFAGPVLDAGGVVLYDPKNSQNYSVSATLSHEIVEMIGDLFANRWSDGPQLSQGSVYALELADPVESNNYTTYVYTNGVLNKVFLSNFVLPRWFDPQATASNAPFDYLKILTMPFSMTSGGYMIVRNGPGSEQQVFGRDVPEWKRDLKNGLFSRYLGRLRGKLTSLNTATPALPTNVDPTIPLNRPGFFVQPSIVSAPITATPPIVVTPPQIVVAPPQVVVAQPTTETKTS